MEDHGIYDQSDDMILYIMSHSINYCMIPPSKLTVCCGSHGPYISMVYSTSSKWWFSTIFHKKKKKTSDLPSFTGRLRVAVHLMWDLLTKGAATRWRTTVPSRSGSEDRIWQSRARKQFQALSNVPSRDSNKKRSSMLSICFYMVKRSSMRLNDYQYCYSFISN